MKSQRTVNVNERSPECTWPEIEILGVSSDIMKPTPFTRASPIMIQSRLALNCDPPRQGRTTWTVVDVSTQQAVFTAQDIVELTIPPDIANGDHSVRLEVYPEGLPAVNVMKEAAIEIISSPLVVFINGGQRKSVPASDVLEIDGSSSYDPDGTTDWNIQWTCEAFPGNSGCFASNLTQYEIGNQALNLTIEQSFLTEATEYQFALRVEVSGRIGTAKQNVTIVSQGEPSLTARSVLHESMYQFMLGAVYAIGVCLVVAPIIK
jgi:hypothetical protein